MEIVVQSVSKHHVVRFSSPFGDCIGIWSAGAVSQKRYEVELDLSQLEDSACIHPAAQSSPDLRCVDNAIYLRGLLEDYESDGLMTIRLGDHLLCVESPYDPAVERLKGSFVELTSGCLYLCDVRLL